MTVNNLKTAVEPTPETTCIQNISQTVDNVQHNVPVTLHYLVFELSERQFVFSSTKLKQLMFMLTSVHETSRRYGNKSLQTK
jgi:hypothetical protein